MSTKIFSNPTGAYGYDVNVATELPTKPQLVFEFEAAAAITVGDIVTIAGNTTGQITTLDTVTDLVVGVALESATGAGDVIRVCTWGVCQVNASTTNVAVGVKFSSNTSGQITTASSTSGQQIVGQMLEASGTTADALKWAFICPTQTA